MYITEKELNALSSAIGVHQNAIENGAEPFEEWHEEGSLLASLELKAIREVARRKAHRKRR